MQTEKLIPKICVFDLDGTIFNVAGCFHDGGRKQNIWMALAKELGETAATEDEEHRVKWKSNGCRNLTTLYSKSVDLHKRHNLTRDHFLQLVHSVPYYTGATQLFSALAESAVICAAVSGGLKEFANRFSVDMGVRHTFAAVEYFWDENGCILGANIIPCDFQNKISFLEMLCRDYEIDLSDCCFVGNGKNDEAIAAKCGMSIGFNPSEGCEPIFSQCVVQPPGKEDLSELIPLLGL